jgi:two-component system chemotaxis sensor kinase CheA
MQAEVLAARMTPVGEVFERFPRLVRDLARDSRQADPLRRRGEEIELDRSMLDEIGEPLLHLIRNAADHGIERPESGRPGESREGRILSRRAGAEQRGLRVSDDGRASTARRILAKAERRVADAARRRP